MPLNENLYIAPEDLYRIGNASSPLLTKVRQADYDLIDMNGIAMIVANGKGASLYNKAGLDKAPLSGWVWEIKSGTSMPPGLVLQKDAAPEGHYTLRPAQNMTVHEYIALLEKVVIQCRKVFKKSA